MEGPTIAGRREARAPCARAERPWLYGLAIILLLAMSHGCSVRDPWHDARIESEVKARLVAEKNANLTRLGVVSRQAVVYLTGTVVSTAEKALAETLAQNVGGVLRVVSTLEVRPAPAGAAASP